MYIFTPNFFLIREEKLFSSLLHQFSEKWLNSEIIHFKVPKMQNENRSRNVGKKKQFLLFLDEEFHFYKKHAPIRDDSQIINANLHVCQSVNPSQLSSWFCISHEMIEIHLYDVKEPIWR